MKFWITWGTAAVVAGVIVFFFLAGLISGSVSSFNAGIWALILLGTTAVMAGSWILKANGRPGAGALLALVLALPGLLAALFILLFAIFPTRWN